MRIIGGKGKDTFNINGNVRNVIYDYKNDSNYIVTCTIKPKIKYQTDPDVNRYDIAGFNYNVYRIPLLNVAFNEEDKSYCRHWIFFKNI